VPEELGNGNDVATTPEGPQGKRVTKRMGTDVLGIDASGDGAAVHHVTYGLGTETAPYQLSGRSIMGAKQRHIYTEPALCGCQVGAQMPGDVCLYGHRAILSALPLSHKQRGLSVLVGKDIGNIDGTRLNHTQAYSHHHGFSVTHVCIWSSSSSTYKQLDSALG